MLVVLVVVGEVMSGVTTYRDDDGVVGVRRVAVLHLLHVCMERAISGWDGIKACLYATCIPLT